MEYNESQACKTWQQYDIGMQYMESKGLAKQFIENVDFYEGRQWRIDSNTARLNVPRVTINIIKLIVTTKRALALARTPRMEFVTSDNSDRARLVTEFADYVSSEMGLQELLAEAVLDAAVKGTYAFHFYWDSIAEGMRGEVIDPSCIFVANPNERDEQKQEWIIIAQRLPVSKVKAMSDKKLHRLIIPDDSDIMYNDYLEQDGSGDDELCTLLTKYYKQNGEVYYERAVRSTPLHEPIAITPEGNSSGATLYPIVIGSWNERNKCIYGISEVDDLLTAQKMLNYMLSLNWTRAELTSWGKYVVKEGALRGQRVTNEIAQVLVDYSPNGINGIRRLEEPSLSQEPIRLIDKMIEWIRMVSNANEIITGDRAMQMSGAAIAQLQSIASKPVEEKTKRLWQSYKRIGNIFMQFFKLFYENKQFTYKGEADAQAAVFNGSEIADVELSCNVEVGASTEFSDAMTISNITYLYERGEISAVQFIKLYPISAMPNKQSLIAELEASTKQKEESISKQLEAIAAKYSELEAYLQQKEAEIMQSDKNIGEISRLKSMLLKLQEEAEQKIEKANGEIEGQNAGILKMLGITSNIGGQAEEVM